MSEDVLAPKSKLFPLFYKKDASIPNAPPAAPPSKAPAKSRSRTSINKNSENSGERRKLKAAARPALQKTDSDSKIASIFSRPLARAKSPMPLSPTSLNHDSPGVHDDADAPSPQPPPVAPAADLADAALLSDALPEPVQKPPTRRLRRVESIVVEDDDDEAPQAPIPAPALPLPTGTRAVPIEIPDSPEKSAPTHAFFARRPKVITLDVPRRKREPLAPSWPDAEMQHVRGDGTAVPLQPAVPSLPSRSARQDLDYDLSADQGTLWTPDVDDTSPGSLTPDEPTASLDTVSNTGSRSNSSYPLPDRDLPASSPSSALSWNELYRPTCAEHVLGNEANARYLRSWLRALQLQLEAPNSSAQPGPRVKLKRPAIVRAVNPKRKRRRASEESDADDWIVTDDDEEVEPAQSDSEDEYAPPPIIHQAGSGLASDEPSFTTLTNVMILTGPSGAGKSAAAYACATELDWSVFEIYPGMCKRSGSNIMSLVGDAARNHLLRLGKSGDFNEGTSKDNAAQPISLDTPTPEPPDRSAGSRTVRQSLFLFDEVDVLFRDDTSFWPTLVSLVADSRRPVILTCNDISLVPVQDLPVQAILEFLPPAPELACSYLQQLAVANGIALDRPAALSLFKPVNSTRQDLPHGDLRQSINALQFWASRIQSSGVSARYDDVDAFATEWDQASASTTTPSASPPADQPNEQQASNDLRHLWRLTDSASQYDFYHGRLADTISHNELPQQEDVVAGQIQLPGSDTMDRLVGSGFLDRALSLKAAAFRAGRHEYESTGAGLRARGSVEPRSARMASKTLPASQRWHQTQQAAFLDSIVPTCMLRVSGRDMALDYVPRIMEMVHADDAFEEQAAAPATEAENPGRGSRRMTRRSRQAQYERYVSLDAKAMLAARVAGTWAEA